jgi:hypothetical protein
MSQRFRLLLIWLCGYLICLTFLLIFLAKNWMLTENFKKDFGTATAIFAPYLTPIIAFWFAKWRNAKATPAKSESYYVAVAMSVIFNLLMLAIIGRSFIQTGEGVIEDNLDLAVTVGAGVTFLVGPAIGYYFGKTS